MLIYQVKIIVDETVHDEWLHWMKTVHVPDVIATGLIKSFQIWKADNPAEIEYRYNYYFGNKIDFGKYQKEYAPTLKAHPHERFPNQFKSTRQVFFQV